MKTDPIRICLEKGWIHQEQALSLRALLMQLPTAEPLSLLEEQEFLSISQLGQLKQELAQLPISSSNALEGGLHIHEYLALAAQTPGCTDLHFHPGEPLWCRTRGVWRLFSEKTPLTVFELERLGKSFLTLKQIALLAKEKKLNFAYTLAHLARFRVHALEQSKQWTLSFRILPLHPPSIHALRFPEQISSFASLTQGFILTCGLPGSGKSTTLAAILESINSTRPARILTLEEPIEYVFQAQRSQINQLEMSYFPQTSWAIVAQRGADRGADVIMLSKIDQAQTLLRLLEIAQNGSLVLAPLYAPTISTALSQLINAFPAEQHSSVRTLLAENIRGIICQRWSFHDSKQELILESLPASSQLAGHIHAGAWEAAQNMARVDVIEPLD